MFYRRRASYLSLIGCFYLASVNGVFAENELPSIPEIQRRHLEENGGIFNFEKLTSMIAYGEIIPAKGEARTFKMYRKRPDLMRLELDMPGGTQATVFDGEKAYILISLPGVADRWIPLSEDRAAHYEADSGLEGLFFKLRGRSEWLEMIGEAEVEGVNAYELVIKEAANLPHDRVWISKENYQEIKLAKSSKNEVGEEILEEVYLSDFEKKDGVWFAKLIRYEVNGELSQTVRIDRIRTNSGVFDIYFRKPEL